MFSTRSVQDVHSHCCSAISTNSHPPRTFILPKLKLCTPYLLTPRPSSPQPQRPPFCLLSLSLWLQVPHISGIIHVWFASLIWLLSLVSCLPGSTLRSHMSEFHVAAFTLPWDFRESQDESLLPGDIIGFPHNQRGPCGLWGASQLTGTHCLPRALRDHCCQAGGEVLGVERASRSESMAKEYCLVLLPSALCAHGFPHRRFLY